MRATVGREGLDRVAASSSQMGRFETDWLARDVNLEALTDLSGTWIDRVHERKLPRTVILDMDSSESPTHGEQEGAVWNGHFGCTCYHPLFLFNHFGDLERSLLRPGNAHSAEDWRLVLEPVIARYRARGTALYFRADAAFASTENRTNAPTTAAASLRSRLSVASPARPGPRGPSEGLPCAANRRIIGLDEPANGKSRLRSRLRAASRAGPGLQRL